MITFQLLLRGKVNQYFVTKIPMRKNKTTNPKEDIQIKPSIGVDMCKGDSTL